jgi:hypothetical protein
MDGSGFVPEFPRRDRRESKWWSIPLLLFWVFVLITLALSSPSPGTELPRALAASPLSSSYVVQQAPGR